MSIKKDDNFGDVFPRRNLGDAENWGRSIEARIEGIERVLTKVAQMVENDARTRGASQEVLADQIREVESQQAALLAQWTTLAQPPAEVEVAPDIDE